MALPDLINKVRTLQQASEQLEALRARKQNLQDQVIQITNEIQAAQQALVQAKQDAKASANAEL